MLRRARVVARSCACCAVGVVGLTGVEGATQGVRAVGHREVDGAKGGATGSAERKKDSLQCNEGSPTTEQAATEPKL